MPTINRPPIGVNNDDGHYEALVKRQAKNDKNHDYTCEDWSFCCFAINLINLSLEKNI